MKWRADQEVRSYGGCASVKRGAGFFVVVFRRRGGAPGPPASILLFRGEAFIVCQSLQLFARQAGFALLLVDGGEGDSCK